MARLAWLVALVALTAAWGGYPVEGQSARVAVAQPVPETGPLYETPEQATLASAPQERW